MSDADRTQLVDRSYSNPDRRLSDTPSMNSSRMSAKRSSSYTEPYVFTADTVPLNNYRAGLGGGCCHLEDTAALRMIVAWMATVAVVVFVALVVEIINQEHVVEVGDIVTDHPNCSQIGIEILQLGGNSVDAAVAAGLCLCVAMPHVAGLGGGGIMLIHQLRSNKTTVLDFQEVSPSNLKIQKYTDNPLIAKLSRYSVAVPGVVAGLWEAHQKFGSGLIRRDCCGWGDLVLKTSKLLGEGFSMTDNWHQVKQWQLQQIGNETGLRRFLQQDGYSQPGTDFNVAMVNTFDNIFEHPTVKFYSESGVLSRKLVSDLKGQLEASDLSNYRVETREPVTSRVGGYRIISTPAPSSGPELVAILNAVEEMLVNDNKTETFDTAEYLGKVMNILESVHIQQRLLGDPKADVEHQHEKNFISTDERMRAMLTRGVGGRLISDRGQSDSGGQVSDSWQEGSQVSVMDSEDVYVSMITSLNSYFGSRLFSQGFLLNNAMARFDQAKFKEPSDSGINSNNQFEEEHRPLSRCAPAIVVNEDEPCGTRIVTGGILAEITAQVLAPVLLSPAGDLSQAIKDPKLVIVNNTVKAEQGFSAKVLADLEKKEAIPKLRLAYSPGNALEKIQDTVHGLADPRGGQQRDKWRTLRPRFTNSGR